MANRLHLLVIPGHDLIKEMREQVELVGVCISCHKDVPFGFFSRVHQKKFHSQVMEEIMEPGSVFHKIFELKQSLNR